MSTSPAEAVRCCVRYHQANVKTVPHTHILSQCRPQPHLTTQLHFTAVQGTAASYHSADHSRILPQCRIQLHFISASHSHILPYSCILLQWRIQLHLITMHATAASYHTAVSYHSAGQDHIIPQCTSQLYFTPDITQTDLLSIIK